MLALAMAFAACWGVLQLAVLGWGTRSVRAGTLLLAVAAGCYGCAVLAFALEFAWTRVVAAVTGASVTSAVRTAGYTVDPFVEEAVKVLPLVVAVLLLRGRRPWALTDFVLLGAATGAGFGLLEALARFGHRTADAAGVGDGWLLPTATDPPLVPGPLTTLTSWLPAPVNAEYVGSLGGGPGTNLHLAWSAVAALGVGLFVRLDGPVRFAGAGLVVLAGADHAAAAHALAVGDPGTLGDVLTAPFDLVRPVVWLWPLLALVAAVVLDVRLLRAARATAPPLRLRRETGRGGLLRYASLHLPWTGLLALRFVLLRRAAHYAPPGDPPPVVAEAADAVARMDVTDDRAAWRGVGLRAVRLGPDEGPGGAGAGPAEVLRRFWPLLLWLALLVPPALYYVAGTTPATAGLQDVLERTAVFGVLFVVPAGFGLVLLAWQLVAGVHALPALLRSSSGDLATSAVLRVATAAGASVLGVLAVASLVDGANPGRRVLEAFHVLEAMDSLLLAAGLALLLAAFAVFPPAVTFAVTRGPGGTRLVPDVAVTTGYAGPALGLPGVMLAQAVANAGGSARPAPGASAPDLPRVPAPEKPPVHHHRLRRIVDDLWHGTDDPARVGDGTTMDVVRNEVLTGRPTHGRFHLGKGRHAVARLTSWLDEFGNAASRTDRSHAWELRARLGAALDGDPAPDLRPAAEHLAERVAAAIPDVRPDLERTVRECGEDGLEGSAAAVFLDEQTRALRYRFRDGVIEARAELAALAAVLEEEHGDDPDRDEVIEACFVAPLSAAGHNPDARDVLGPRLAAVVDERRRWRASEAARAFVARVTAALPVLERPAAENRYGEADDVLVHGFLADAAFRAADQQRAGGPAALAENRALLELLTAELGRHRGVDEAITVSFLANLPRPGMPGADLLEPLPEPVRAELGRYRDVTAGPAG
jgi:hypothetical protein